MSPLDRLITAAQIAGIALLVAAAVVLVVVTIFFAFALGTRVYLEVVQ